MKLLVFIIIIALNLSTFGQRKQVCFSFDDLPFVSYRLTDSILHQDLANRIILSLKKNKIPAIGFVNEKKLYNQDGSINSHAEILRKWIDHGLDLGNHTFSHQDYNLVSLNEFTRDVIKGEIVTKEILRGKNRSVKYFRHPFLHTGNSKVKADSLNDFLRGYGYTVAPVTIDNDDYLFASAYEGAKVKNNLQLMSQIGDDYVIYTEKKLLYYEKQARDLFGRDIKHILLLHPSFLNSDYLDSLVIMFRKNNYVFVRLDRALRDKAFASEVTRFGNWGISWIDRWALSKGREGSFFKEEPKVPDYIVKLLSTNGE